jgi:murein DD-endopeptidase MepM/ murein hydrolase activator NlpD
MAKSLARLAHGGTSGVESALRRAASKRDRMIVKLASSAVATLVFAATPALAEDSLITSPADGIIQIETVAGGMADSEPDTEFSNLFASWEALDDGGIIGNGDTIVPAPRASVSVPSRMPVDGLRMSSGYGMRTHPVLGDRRQHNGVDLAAAHGTPVYATADGLIGKAQYWGSYGNYVQIEHGGELQTRYAHLSSYTVRMGDLVQKGDLIGYIGSTGRSTGPHLHYEVRVAGQPVDPRPYMVGTELAVDEHGLGGVGGPE